MSDVSTETLASPEGALTLLELRGIGPQAVAQLTSRFRRLEEILEAQNELLSFITAAARASLRDRGLVAEARVRALRALDAARARGIRVVTPQSEEYPAWMRLLQDRPPVLYVRGRLLHGHKYVASIGTREPSPFGVTATERVTKALVACGWSIVSGLALGVDTLAHRACLDAGGHTVAVLANGLDSVYPKANARLAEEILEKGGALVSEQPVGAPAIPRNLVQRDRLQSGMSAGTIVNQTDVIGGSMHTARFTLMQGRVLFAPVPRDEHARAAKSQGILALATRPARELVRLLKLEEDSEYAQLLRRRGDEPAAVGLNSKDDYPRMFELLERTVAAAPAERAKPREQLGLALAR